MVLCAPRRSDEPVTRRLMNGRGLLIDCRRNTVRQSIITMVLRRRMDVPSARDVRIW